MFGIVIWMYYLLFKLTRFLLLAQASSKSALDIVRTWIIGARARGSEVSPWEKAENTLIACSPGQMKNERKKTADLARRGGSDLLAYGPIIWVLVVFRAMVQVYRCIFLLKLYLLFCLVVTGELVSLRGIIEGVREISSVTIISTVVWNLCALCSL